MQIDDAAWLSFRLLLLLAVANTSPIIAKRVCGSRWAGPLDGGLRFFDGRPLLGPSKTLRGVLVAVVATGLAAMVLRFPVQLGLLMGAASMLGDALSSFVKRRLDIASSGRATGLDQIPEALLPLLVVRAAVGLSFVQVIVIALVFFALEIPLARLFHRLGLRDEPY